MKEERMKLKEGNNHMICDTCHNTMAMTHVRVGMEEVLNISTILAIN